MWFHRTSVLSLRLLLFIPLCRYVCLSSESSSIDLPPLGQNILSFPHHTHFDQGMDEFPIEAHQPIAAEGSRYKPAEICGHLELHILQQPVQEHNQAKCACHFPGYLNKRCENTSKNVPHANAGAPCTERKLVPTDLKAPFRKLVTAYSVSQFHQDLINHHISSGS